MTDDGMMTPEEFDARFSKAPITLDVRLRRGPVYQDPAAVALLELQAIRNRVITASEKRTADECIEVVRTAFGVKE